MYMRTKLMKCVEVVKVPTYKWVIEEVPVCDCGETCGCDAMMTDAEAARGIEVQIRTVIPPRRESSQCTLLIPACAGMTT